MIDFESRSDALSILEYLKQISPRQTVTLHYSLSLISIIHERYRY
jgi:hypothetical protein